MWNLPFLTSTKWWQEVGQCLCYLNFNLPYLNWSFVQSYLSVVQTTSWLFSWHEDWCLEMCFTHLFVLLHCFVFRANTQQRVMSGHLLWHCGRSWPWLGGGPLTAWPTNRWLKTATITTWPMEWNSVLISQRCALVKSMIWWSSAVIVTRQSVPDSKRFTCSYRGRTWGTGRTAMVVQS